RNGHFFPFDEVDDLEAVHLRNHQVEDEDGVAAAAQFLQRRLAVGGAVDIDVATLQEALDEAADAGVVLDQQRTMSLFCERHASGQFKRLNSASMRRMVLLLLTAFVCLPSVNADEFSAASLDKRRRALQDLLKEQWDDSLRRAPEYASILGDRRWNDKSSDLSEAAALANIASAKKFLKRFEAIDTTGFDEQEKLDKELMLLDLRNDIEDETFTPWLMPVTQMAGYHLNAAQIPALLTFAGVKDYDDYLTRLHNVPKQFAQTEANMRKGMARKLMPPKFLLGKVADQAGQISKMDAEASPFARPLAKFPASVLPDEQ